MVKAQDEDVKQTENTKFEDIIAIANLLKDLSNDLVRDVKNITIGLNLYEQSNEKTT